MTSAKTPARKPAASRSGNPATKAAAERDAAAKAAAERAEMEAAQAAAREQFANLKLDAPVLDDEGYEIVPDKSALDGGSYKFKIRGERFSLPNLQYLPLAYAQQLNEATTEAQAQALIFGKYCPTLFDVASADELMHVMKRWMDFSKSSVMGESISLGE